MGCDFYIYTYLKLYTSNGIFERHIETTRGWITSRNYTKYMDYPKKEYIIYENNKYIENFFHNYHDEYNDIITDMFLEVNRKIINENTDNQNNNVSFHDIKLIDFKNIIKITLLSHTCERT